jgi:hypothetical protein
MYKKDHELPIQSSLVQSSTVNRPDTYRECKELSGGRQHRQHHRTECNSFKQSVLWKLIRAIIYEPKITATAPNTLAQCMVSSLW